MKLKQISVPIENAQERLPELTRALADEGINLRGMNLVDTGHFGELRILVSDMVRARQILMAKHIPARVDEVVAIEIQDRPGAFADLAERLTKAGIKIRYAYACGGMNSGRAIMVFCFTDNDRAIEILNSADVFILNWEALGMLEAAASAA